MSGRRPEGESQWCANTYQRMVLEYYVKRVTDVRERRRTRMNAIRTRAQAERYRAAVRRTIKRSFGCMPPKTPLKARVTGTLQQNGYRIEKVLFESRPGFLVSANLYVPDRLSGPAPAVVGACGHSGEGKAADFYQSFSQALVKRGFVVLTYDPIDQGERDQYVGLAKSKQPGVCCPAHNMIGKQMELVGEFFGAWRAWDGIRAHDYLRSRVEVDNSRIGVTGNSGGGTMTTWLRGLDSRFAAAAPSCFVSTFHRNVTNEEPADAEQCPPNILRDECDHADFLIAGLPNPVILLGQKYDFFDVRGLEEAYGDVRKINRLLGGKADGVELFIGPDRHGYYPKNREAMVEFFCRHLRLSKPRRVTVAPLPVAATHATKGGQVVRSGSRRTYEIIGAQARSLARARPRVSKLELPGLLRSVLTIPAARGTTPDYRIMKPCGVLSATSGGTVARFAVQTEPDIQAVLKKVVRPGSMPTCIDAVAHASLWVPHTSSLEDMRADALARSLHKKPDTFYLDVRGLGESMPICRKDGFFSPYDWDYMFHSHGLMLGESYLGRRVFDLLRTIDLLRAEGVRRLDLYGRGLGSVIALLGGCLHPGVRTVTLKNHIESFEALTQVPYTAWAASVLPWKALQRFDLPDCRRFLGKRVRLMEPWGAEPSKTKFPGAV